MDLMMADSVEFVGCDLGWIVVVTRGDVVTTFEMTHEEFNRLQRGDL